MQKDHSKSSHISKFLSILIPPGQITLGWRNVNTKEEFHFHESCVQSLVVVIYQYIWYFKNLSSILFNNVLVEYSVSIGAHFITILCNLFRCIFKCLSFRSAKYFLQIWVDKNYFRKQPNIEVNTSLVDGLVLLDDRASAGNVMATLEPRKYLGPAIEQQFPAEHSCVERQWVPWSWLLHTQIY